MSEIESVIQKIRLRAKYSRRVYNLNVVFMLTLVLVLVGIYLFGKGYVFSGSGEFSQGLILMVVISNSIVKIGAVAIGIFGVQIMFSFARYHIRLANHLEATADALELCGTESDRLETILNSLIPANIDFGKVPSSPTDKMFKVVQDIVKKIPNQP